MNLSEPISVVVTTYNRSDALIAVLAGLSRQTDRNFEVIVADDGSGDEHRARIVRSAEFLSMQAIHVWHPDNGFRAAKVRNLGVEQSRGAYLVFLDGDCVPEVDFVAQHRRLAQQGHFVNGSRILLSPGFTARALASPAQLCGRGRMHWLGRRLVGDASRWWGTWRLPDGAYRVEHEFRWKGIRSCNMAVWKSDFVAVDGFDEIYVGWGHEDADLVLRLHHLGVRRKNGFCATEVFHLWHAESSRSQETDNARRVQARAAGTLVRAASGYGQVRVPGEVQVTRQG